MSAIQKFFLVIALTGGAIFYVAAALLPQPPLWISLFGREVVTVTAATVETRAEAPSALPVIDVRDAAGSVSLLQGYGWTSKASADDVIAAFSVGDSVEAGRYDGQLWRGLSGVFDWILLGISLIAAFATLFGLWMVWKLRGTA